MGRPGSCWDGLFVVISDMATYRAVFVSDLHIGTKYANVQAFLQFLKANEFEYLYIVGDFIDGWALSFKWYWAEDYNLVVQKLLRLARKGVKITYLPGNHDEFMRQFIGHNFGGIEITNEVVHKAASGKNYLVVHGDAFDGVLTKFPWVSHVGAFCYEVLLSLNHKVNRLRKLFRLKYWSLSHYLKMKAKKAVQFTSRFEEALTDYARRKSVDGVVCGHIHCPTQKQLNGIEYHNTGCWVEMATAIVETPEGKFELLKLL